MSKVKEVVIEAEDEGYNAFMEKKDKTDNPYPYKSLQYLAWNAGFDGGLEDLVITAYGSS